MPDETHGSVPHRSLYDGLEWMFEGWAPPDLATIAQLDGEQGWLEISGHYASLSERLGYDIPVPEDAVDGLARGLVRLGRHDDAIRELERNAVLSPGSGRAFNHLGDVFRTVCRWDESKANYTKALSMAGFSKDAFGAVDAVTLHQNGSDQRASRMR